MKTFILSLLFTLYAAPSFAAKHAVTIEGFEFNPSELTVQTGDTVVFTNADSAAHTATADDGSFDSGNVGEGESWELTVTKKGAFPYHCEYHGSMTGRITVK